MKTSKHFGESHAANNSGKRAGMRVFIIESSYPKDFYEQKLDGIAAQGILNILGVENELRFVLDRKHFEKAIADAKAMNCNLIHLSCHGGEDGIALADNYQPSWDKFADLFQGIAWCPHALVMSSCCGATSGIRKAFQTKPRRPEIIFGSSDERSYGEYTVAWAILYHRFKIDGVNKDAAQQALKEIHAVVSDNSSIVGGAIPGVNIDFTLGRRTHMRLRTPGSTRSHPELCQRGLRTYTTLLPLLTANVSCQ